MDTLKAKQLAEELMTQYLDNSWGFKFDLKTNRLGSTQFRSKIITLSRSLLPITKPSLVREAILHEIAHARTWDLYSKTKLPEAMSHSREWELENIKIGGTGRVKFNLTKELASV